MRRSIYLWAFIGAMMVCSCKSSKEVTTTAFHEYPTECLGKSMDGKQVLRVWASGQNRKDAVEQAKKKAVYVVVFEGISAGNGDCSAYPVVDEANARQKYEDYFDVFFANGGEYTKYVSMEKQQKESMQRHQGDGLETSGIVVTVDRSALRKRFQEDNVIVKTVK